MLHTLAINLFIITFLIILLIFCHIDICSQNFTGGNDNESIDANDDNEVDDDDENGSDDE